MVFSNKQIENASEWLVGIGAANWGLTRFADVNVVELISTNETYLMVVYGLVGAAGLYKIAKLLGLIK